MRGYTGLVTSETQPSQNTRTHLIIQAIRGLLHLIAVISVTAWGFLAWDLPLPGVFVAIAAFGTSVALWALFLSPRPVLRTDRFGQSLIELLLLAAAVAALLTIGVPWIVAVLYGLIGAVLGYIATSRAK